MFSTVYWTRPSVQEELEYCDKTEGGPKTGSVFALQGYYIVWYKSTMWCLHWDLQTKFSEADFLERKQSGVDTPASLLISRPNMN